MYTAKAFYELAGVKRSTVRHFVEMGILKPATIQENGYALYDDAQLLDIICLKNERSLDFSILDIESIRKSDLATRIDRIDRRKQDYQREISILQHKIDTLEMYRRILAEMVDHKEPIRIDRKGRRVQAAFWISSATGCSQREIAEEIAHCVEAFPFVRVILRGNLHEANQDISMEIGYLYEPAEQNFTPLHSALYESIPASPCVLMRTVTHSPLQIDKARLRPLLKAADEENMRLSGILYAYVHAVEKTTNGNLYYMTIRLVSEPETGVSRSESSRH